jgi:hypothetical protein|tara:strand:+ start:8616 stop:8960 length:345 start_codon:yes stop_codon:yes gene_type:complete
MAEIIDITKYIKKKEEENLNDMSQRLADIISGLDMSEQYKMYMEESDNYVYGMPYLFTMFPTQPADEVKSLSDVTDVLTTLTITLDGMGHSKWADQISSIVGDMFQSGSFTAGQ